MEYFLLYLFTKLSVLHSLANLAIIFGGGFWVFIKWGEWALGPCPYKCGVKWAKWAVIVGVLVGLLVPTQKDVGIIVGGKMAIDIAKSEEVSTISKKIFAVVNKKLDEASK